MGLPSRRGIYFLEARAPSEGGLYIWVRHRRPGEGRKRKYGRKLAPYFERRGWSLSKHLNDKRIMEVVGEIGREVDNETDGVASPPEEGDPTPLLQLVEEYTGELEARGLNAQHVRGVRRRLRASLGRSKRARETSPFAWAVLGDLDRRELERYLLARRRAGRSAKECSHDLRAWSAFANWLVQGGRAQASPFGLMRSFRGVEAAPKVLTADEINRLLEKCRQPAGSLPCKGSRRRVPIQGSPAWLFRAVKILSCTGMRPVELARLRWEQVDLDQGTATVLRKGGDQWVVPLVGEVVEMLSGTPKGERAGPVVPGFPYREDRTKPGGYFTAFRRAARDAGLEGVSLYWLRHSVATHLAKAGESAARLQAIMGWKSIRMAMRYVRLAGQDVRGATEKLPWVHAR